MEIPSTLPAVYFAGLATQQSASGDPETLKRDEIESAEQFRDFLKNGSRYGRAMYFDVTAVSRKGAEVKAEREAKTVLSLKDSEGDYMFSDRMWSTGQSSSYVDELRLIDPREAFFENRPSLTPDEYIVKVGVTFNPF